MGVRTIVIVAVLGACACGTSISGTVTAYGSGQPVAADVKVWHSHCDVELVLGVPIPRNCQDIDDALLKTDAKGHFAAGGLEPRNYWVSVVAGGYLGQDIDVDATEDAKRDVVLFPVPPSPITDLTLQTTPAGLQLSWTNPPEPNFAGVLLLRRGGQGITESNLEQVHPYAVGDAVNDWTVVFRGNATGFLDEALPDGDWKYRAYSFSDLSVYNLAPTSDGPWNYDGTAPGVPTNLAAAQHANGVTLTWTDAADAWAALVVRTGGGVPVVEAPAWGAEYPPGATFDNGQAVVMDRPSFGNYLDDTVIPPTSYRYTLFAVDLAGNYAPGIFIDVQTVDPPPP